MRTSKNIFLTLVARSIELFSLAQRPCNDNQRAKIKYYKFKELDSEQVEAPKDVWINLSSTSLTIRNWNDSLK